MQEYTVVQAEWTHLAPLAEVERAAARLFPLEDVPVHLRSETTPFEELEAAQRRGRLWVALAASGRPVGFAQVERIDGLPHLEELDVHPDFGRRGIGAALVRAVCRAARGEGASAITLATFRHLPWNAPFYAALGFDTVGDDSLGAGMRELLRQEAKAGLNAANRVCMRMLLA
jgi:GNAT superfamily N-acetyltransferase